MRKTKNREDIYGYLLKHNKPFTPYELAKNLTLNHVTVYRVLEYLKSISKVHEISSLGKWSACQFETNHQENHGFLICQQCTSIKEFLSPHHCDFNSDFQCKEHKIEIIGTCRNCQ